MVIGELSTLSDYETEMITEIIEQHHKFTSWKRNVTKGNSLVENHRMETVVNAIRCADWADATMGMIRPMGCSSPNMIIQMNYLQYLYHHLYESGFHNILTIVPSLISPTSYRGQLQILRILKW